MSGRALLALAGGLLWAASATAHTRPDTRQALLQISPTHVELVVHWSMKDGVEAGEIRRRLDGNGDRRITLKVEKLGQAQLLMPRLQRGLTAWHGDRQLRFEVVEVKFKDAPWSGERTGFEALVLFRATADLSAPGKITLALTEGPPTQVMAQGRGLQLQSAELPVRPGDPVLGPVTLSPGATAQVTVRTRPKATSRL